MTGLVVVGSGPAGVAAATAYRDAGGPGPIALLSADGAAPYERPPLSKEVLAGTAADPTPIDADLTGIDVRLDTTVTGIDTTARQLTTADGATVPYDRLVICAGARPIRLPGQDDSQVHVLRSLALARSLVADAEQARTAIVVGSGFIGCEAAVSLASRGTEVTMVTRSSQPQSDRVGRFAADKLAGWLAEAGVTVRTEAAVAEVRGPRTVVLESGEALEADVVLVALGIEPSGDLGSGLPTEQGRLLVDDHLSTGVDGVWAAGDGVLAEHAVAGRRIATEHWDDATTQGTIAGQNAAGQDRAWQEIPSFWSDLGDHPLQWAGWDDGFDTDHGSEDDQGWTVWYGKDGVCVGVLTSNHYDDDDRGKQLIADHRPVPH